MTSKFFNGFPLTIRWNLIFLPSVQGPSWSNPCLPESRVNPTTAHLEFYAPETQTIPIPWINISCSYCSYDCILCVPFVWNMCPATYAPVNSCSCFKSQLTCHSLWSLALIFLGRLKPCFLLSSHSSLHWALVWCQSFSSPLYSCVLRAETMKFHLSSPAWHNAWHRGLRYMC